MNSARRVCWKGTTALASMAQLVGASSHNQRDWHFRARAWVMSSIPSLGTYRRRPVHASLPSSQCFFSLPLSQKAVKLMSLGKDTIISKKERIPKILVCFRTYILIIKLIMSHMPVIFLKLSFIWSKRDQWCSGDFSPSMSLFLYVWLRLSKKLSSTTIY